MLGGGAGRGDECGGEAWRGGRQSVVDDWPEKKAEERHHQTTGSGRLERKENEAPGLENRVLLQMIWIQ